MGPHQAFLAHREMNAMAAASDAGRTLTVAVVVDDDDVPALRAAIGQLYFEGDDAQSTAPTTARLAAALKAAPFRLYALAVDRQRLARDAGAARHASVEDFVNSRLYSVLFQDLLDVTVVADVQRDGVFATRFAAYVEQQPLPDLFSQLRINTIDSGSDAIMRLAHYLAAQVAALYDPASSIESRNALLAVLLTRQLRIDEWPPEIESRLPANSDDDVNAEIRAIAMRAATRFLTDFAGVEDADIRKQHALLSYLLFRARFPAGPAGDGFTAAEELVDHLRSLGFDDVNDHHLRSNVVAPLRDRDILIASSARGYKIPTTYADMIGFAERIDGMVGPLLHRLKRANDLLRAESAGAIDFLAHERFGHLRALLALA